MATRGPPHTMRANSAKPMEIDPRSDVLTAAQSTQIVQTLLHGCLSCLAYLRFLFAEKCFDDKAYSSGDKYRSYDAYTTEKVTVGLDSGDNRHIVTMGKFLCRGRGKSSDQFLDWLEKGAFEALRRNVLRALQLRIFVDPDQPENVVETHTFTLNYSDDPPESRRLINLEIKGPEGELLSITNAQQAMQTLIRHMVVYCQTLPYLPATRYMSMNLFYIDGCEPNYEPPGFCACDSDKLFFPNGQTWSMLKYPGGPFKTKYHGVKLVISHLDAKNLPPRTDESGNVIAHEMPARHAYNLAVDTEADIDVKDPPATSLHVETLPAELQLSDIVHLGSESPESSIRVSDHADDDLSVVFESNNGPTQPGTTEYAAHSIDLDSPVAVDPDQFNSSTSLEDALLDAGVLTQRTGTTVPLSQDLRAKAELNGMLRSSQPEDEVDTMTQSVRPKRLPQKALSTMAEPSQPGRSDSAIQESLPPVQVCFSQTKISELDSRKKKAERRGRKPERSKSGSKIVPAEEQEDIVGCQCGFEKEEDAMVNCAYCDTWQHLHCYGYLGPEDKRLPQVHACYKCLLEEKEQPLIEGMKSLVITRRAIHVIGKRGYAGDADLARILHYDTQTASNTSAQLKAEGVVVRIQPRTKSSSQAPARSRYGLSKDAAILKSMREKYFNPASKIVHHLQLPKGQPSPVLPEDESIGPVQPVIEVPESMPNSQLLCTPVANRRKRSRVQDSATSTPRRSARKRARTSKTKNYLDVGKFT